MKWFKIILIMFLVGDCIRLAGGVFKGSYWTITAVNEDGTFDLKDKDWTLPKVRGSYLLPAEKQFCTEN